MDERFWNSLEIDCSPPILSGPRSWTLIASRTNYTHDCQISEDFEGRLDEMKKAGFRTLWIPGVSQEPIPFTPTLGELVYEALRPDMPEVSLSPNFQWLKDLCYYLVNRANAILDDAYMVAKLFSDHAETESMERYYHHPTFLNPIESLDEGDQSDVQAAVQEIFDLVLAVKHEPGPMNFQGLPKTTVKLMSIFCQWTTAFCIMLDLEETELGGLSILSGPTTKMIEMSGRRSAELDAGCRQLLEQQIKERSLRDDGSDDSSDDDEIKGLDLEFRQQDEKLKDLSSQ